MTESVPALVELPEPRPLTAAERALVTRLVAFAGVPELTAQLATTRVVSTCDCGCASVGFRSAGPAVPPAVVARLSGTGRDDYVAVTAAAGADVRVTLHVLSGLVGELELFAGDGVRVVTPPADELTDLRIE